MARTGALVTEVKEVGSIVVHWNGRFQTCRVQDVRRALVLFSSFLTHDCEWTRASPTQVLITFAESQQRCVIRLGFV